MVILLWYHLYTVILFNSSSFILTGQDRPNTMSTDAAKKIAARRAVDDHVTKDRMKLGIGTGSTILYIIKYITDLLIHNPTYNTFYVIPTSIQTKHLLILEARRISRATNSTSQLIVTDLDSHPIIDVAFDGADEIDTNTLNAIKGLLEYYVN